MSDNPLPEEHGTSAFPRVTEPFLAGYFAQLSPDELQGYGAETPNAWAGHHLKLAAIREPGQAVVGILNELDASIVAIVADDLPYLVQSVTAELTRDDVSLRLLVHPRFQVLRDPVSHELLEAWTASSRKASWPGAAGKTAPRRSGSPPKSAS